MGRNNEKWVKPGLLRPITLQTHVDPVPELIIRNSLSNLGKTKKEHRGLADEPQKMDWYTANGPDGAAKHTPAVTGYTWRVPAQSEFKQIFKATSGAEDNYKNPNDLLAVFGDSCKLPWEDEVGTSTPTTYLGMDEYWFVDLYHNVADYALFHASKSHACIIRACFAF